MFLERRNPPREFPVNVFSLQQPTEIAAVRINGERPPIYVVANFSQCPHQLQTFYFVSVVVLLGFAQFAANICHRFAYSSLFSSKTALIPFKLASVCSSSLEIPTSHTITGAVTSFSYSLFCHGLVMDFRPIRSDVRIFLQ